MRPGFPGGSDGKKSAAMRETQVCSLSWEDPLEKRMATHSSILGLPFVAKMIKNPPAKQETWVRSLG